MPQGNGAYAGHKQHSAAYNSQHAPGARVPPYKWQGTAYIPQQPPRRGAGAERAAKMALLRQVYGSLFRRTSTFALSVVLGAVLFERVFDQGADALFEQLNEGVRAV